MIDSDMAKELFPNYHNGLGANDVQRWIEMEEEEEDSTIQILDKLIRKDWEEEAKQLGLTPEETERRWGKMEDQREEKLRKDIEEAFPQGHISPLESIQRDID